MQNTDIKNVYTYQTRFTSIEAPIVALFFTLIVLSWFPAFFGILRYESILPSTVRFAFFFDITAFFLVFIALVFKKELKKNIYAITDYALIYRAPGKITFISFSEIVACRYIRTPFTNGHVFITSGLKSIVVPFSLKNIRCLLLEIQEGLIANGTTGAIDKSTVDAMMTTAEIQEDAYERGTRYFRPLVVSMLALAFINMYLAFDFWELGVTSLVIWSVIGLVIPYFVYITAEFLIGYQIRKENNQQDSGKAESVSVVQENYLLSIFIFLLVYLSTGLLIKFI